MISTCARRFCGGADVEPAEQQVDGRGERGQGQHEVPVHAGEVLRAAVPLRPGLHGRRYQQPHQRHPHDTHHLALLQHVRTHDGALHQGRYTSFTHHHHRYAFARGAGTSLEF